MDKIWAIIDKFFDSLFTISIPRLTEEGTLSRLASLSPLMAGTTIVVLTKSIHQHLI